MHRRHGIQSISLVFFLTVVLSSTVATAQISSSPYSVYGIGTLRDRTSAMNRAMGGTGIAVRDPLNLSNLNPASYTSIQQATQVTEFGIFMESDHYGDKKQSTSSKTGSITNLNIWLRFHKRWAGAVGANPFSTVKYNIGTNQTAGDNSQLQYSGNGGITQFYFGNAFMVTKNLSLGFTASFLHGSIDRLETITTGFASGTQLSTLTYVNQGNIDFGAQYTIMMGEDKSFTIGAIYDNKLRLNTRRQTTVYQKTDTIASDKVKINDYVLPQKAGAGLSFQTARHIFTADVSYQQWSKANLDDDLKLRDSRRASVGYQFRGSPRSAFWNGVVFRTGGYIQENPLVLQNTSFRDWGLTFGIGLPVSNRRNALNLSYSYNRSGTLERNLINQQSHIFALDITFRDLWGIKRKFD